VGGADEVKKYYRKLRKQSSLRPPGLMPPLPELKTETFDAPPQPPELDENLIAQEIAESLIKCASVKDIVPTGQTE